MLDVNSLKANEDSEDRDVSASAAQQHTVFFDILERKSNISVIPKSIDNITNVYIHPDLFVLNHLQYVLLIFFKEIC